VALLIAHHHGVALAPGQCLRQRRVGIEAVAPLLERRYDNVPARSRDLEQLEAVASRARDRAQFLAELALDPPSYTQDLAGPPVLDEDYLVLSTMHSAKGLEFDTVFVIHAADGNIPSDMATGSPEEIDEERRLFYVACTRARNQLNITHPLRYYAQPWARSDAHGFAQCTRFVTDRVRTHLIETQTCPAASGTRDQPGRRPSVVCSTAIRSETRHLWE